MSEVQNDTQRFFKHADFSDRDWIPRRCIKMSCIHRDYLRSLLRELIRKRVNGCSETVQLTISEEDFNYLMELLWAVEDARFIKSSLQGLTTYGDTSTRENVRQGFANSRKKKNPQ